MRNHRFYLLLIALLSFGALAQTVVETQKGEAAYYSDKLHGNKTASGEPYDKNALTAAHRELPFGTKVKVTYLENGNTVVVVINDRGPHTEGRIIDVSSAAADKLGLKQAGHGMVKLEIYGD